MVGGIAVDESTPLQASVESASSGSWSKCGRGRFPILVGFIFASFPAFLFGYDISATSGAITSIGLSYGKAGLSSGQAAVLSSGSLIGATVSSVAVFWIGPVLGRRGELMLGSFFYLLGTIITCVANQALPYTCVLVGRIVYGLGIALSMHGAPIFISEIAPPDIRGLLIAGKESFVVGGMAVGYAIAWGTDVPSMLRTRWLYLWIPPGAIAILNFVVHYFYLHPSPRWLTLRGRRDEAVAALRFYRPEADDASIQKEVAEMDEVVLAAPSKPPASSGGADGAKTEDLREKEDEDASSASLFVEMLTHRRALIAGLGLIILQQLTGQPAVLYSTEDIFRNAGFRSSGAESSFIVGIAKLIATMVSGLLVDRAGRRPLLLVGITLMVFALVFLSVGVAFRWNACVLAMMILYVVAYQVGFGPVTWLVISEVFPLRTRTQALSVSVVVNFGLNLVMVMTNSAMVHGMGLYAVFALFACLSLVSILFVWFFVPETKGKTLEEIEAMLAL